MTYFFMQRFIKYNQSQFSDSLICEATGLELLRETLVKTGNDFIKIPQVFEVNQKQLVLERIDTVSVSSEQWFKFGQTLAKLHQVSKKDYGFDSDNYIGLNPQKNSLSQNWGDFFFEYRLMYQVSLIQDKTIKKEFAEKLNHKKSALIKLLNQSCEQASLIHGDLWSGNVLFDKNNAWLIDPAVYYGDREADIAMTEMFGGFSSEFYKGYDSVFPRSSEYQNKKTIYNLYHYLNHYNLFGDGYLAKTKQLIENIKRGNLCVL